MLDPPPRGLVRGDLSGVVWPAVPSGMAAILGAVLWQLEQSQWWSPERLANHQRLQLARLVQHFHKHSPAFRKRLHRARLTPDDLAVADGLRRLPVLTRRELQGAADDFFCPASRLPPEHLPISQAHTSGSTGEPVTVQKTAVSHFFWMALTMRDHLWYQRDFQRPLIAIRANLDERTVLDNWGPPASLLYDTGASIGLPITMPIVELADVIREIHPGSLLVYPTALAALLDHYRAGTITPPMIEHVRSVGETLDPDLQQRAAALFQARVSDCYSSQELGYIALECPVSGLYHVMAENLLIELLNAEDRPCREGETGRIVATDLHNFATPMVRYDIADYAEAAGPCACGRGLPTLKRIVGRIRNLALLPDGSRRWLRVGFAQFRDVAPVVQYQFVQHDRQRIEVRLVVEQPLTSAQEDALRAVITKSVNHPFVIDFSYHAGRLAAGSSGKFEVFICRAT